MGSEGSQPSGDTVFHRNIKTGMDQRFAEEGFSLKTDNRALMFEGGL